MLFRSSGLNTSTEYTIVVVAQNSAGYYVRQITQSTAGIAPVLDSLDISAFGSNSITIAQPAFTTAGNPAPTVTAYIGYNGTIGILYGTVYGFLQSHDVSTGAYQFSGLATNTTYKIIVVAQNSAGYSVQEIVQSTSGVAPVLNEIGRAHV